ncbi:MAG: hypothetical protein LBK58_12310 [Prevotellaceae bacterium]|nr:hypothetical protein [Prevotellaceae bacterium]
MYSMRAEVVGLSQIKTNDANPRQIKDSRFTKLVNSILIFPKMLEIRPIVVDDTFTARNIKSRILNCQAAIWGIMRSLLSCLRKKAWIKPNL